MDTLSILSDDGLCDPALFFWLVEELLESQTIAGCRTIFDYLESRRERVIAKLFQPKKLVILRTCNELLRRLSRAEDPSFCGRVFIFLFQSFPLGDRSSVNLRGEYHLENVTTYDMSPSEEDSKMDVDAQAEQKESQDPKGHSKGSTTTSKEADKPLETEALYPLFWSLQESFSQPLKLFDTGHFAKFKQSLEATIKTFRAIPKGGDSRPSKSTENPSQSLKRKRDEDDSDLPEAFNPKYLTSKDLFKLEVSACSTSWFRISLTCHRSVIFHSGATYWSKYS